MYQLVHYDVMHYNGELYELKNYYCVFVHNKNIHTKNHKIFYYYTKRDNLSMIVADEKMMYLLLLKILNMSAPGLLADLLRHSKENLLKLKYFHFHTTCLKW